MIENFKQKSKETTQSTAALPSRCFFSCKYVWRLKYRNRGKSWKLKLNRDVVLLFFYFLFVCFSFCFRFKFINLFREHEKVCTHIFFLLQIHILWFSDSFCINQISSTTSLKWIAKKNDKNIFLSTKKALISRNVNFVKNCE